MVGKVISCLENQPQSVATQTCLEDVLNKNPAGLQATKPQMGSQIQQKINQMTLQGLHAPLRQEGTSF